jgi:hypothetical protein
MTTPEPTKRKRAAASRSRSTTSLAPSCAEPLAAESPPSPNGSIGHGAAPPLSPADPHTPERTEGGRFALGNKGGPGNPYAARVGRWRAIMTEAVTDDDMRAVVAALVAAAKRGESWAVREVFDRTVGKPVEADLVARLEQLEAATKLKEYR